MTILIEQVEDCAVALQSFPFLRYNDPQVRYEFGKLLASLEALNEKGKRDEKIILERNCDIDAPGSQ